MNGAPWGSAVQSTFLEASGGVTPGLSKHVSKAYLKIQHQTLVVSLSSIITVTCLPACLFNIYLLLNKISQN